MRKSLREFEGQVNSHTKLPLIVSEEDSLVIAGKLAISDKLYVLLISSYSGNEKKQDQP